ncbi:MAG TPA: sulfotransferase [Mycobacteriales bacterium]|nr:sulfotransferase [Mycobacteriales bacterium]
MRGTEADAEALRGGPPRRRARRLRHELLIRARVASGTYRVLPDFVVVGAMKAGSTTLFDLIGQHPRVRTATKEVRYFDLYHRRSLRWYSAHLPPGGRAARDWLTGEATPSYLYDERVPERVAAALPGVKAIALVRHPIDRTYSHYQHNRANGFETLSFDEALAAEPARLAHYRDGYERGERQATARFNLFSYVRRSMYADQIARWQEALGAQQLLVVRSEDLFADPYPTIANVFGFLGLDDARINATAKNTRDYAPLGGTQRALLAQTFGPDVARLESMLGRTLGWDLPTDLRSGA